MGVIAGRHVVAALACAGVVAVQAPAAVAATQTATCTASALVVPLLESPQCETAAINVPGTASPTVSGTVQVTRLAGAGATGGKIVVADVTEPRGLELAECTGGSTGCTGSASVAWDGSVQGDFSFKAGCISTGQSLGVLQRVDCSLTITW